MEAGRALDAEVAVKVLKVPMCPKRFIKWTISGLLNAWDCPEHGLEGCVSDSAVPHYSTSISDAWQVVERADEVELWNHTGKQFGCRLIFGDREGRSVADTAPLAICRAALVAVGAEVPA